MQTKKKDLSTKTARLPLARLGPGSATFSVDRQTIQSRQNQKQVRKSVRLFTTKPTGRSQKLAHPADQSTTTGILSKARRSMSLPSTLPLRLPFFAERHPCRCSALGSPGFALGGTMYCQPYTKKVASPGAPLATSPQILPRQRVPHGRGRLWDGRNGSEGSRHPAGGAPRGQRRPQIEPTPGAGSAAGRCSPAGAVPCQAERGELGWSLRRRRAARSM